MAVPDDDEHLRALTAEGRVLLAITPDQGRPQAGRTGAWTDCPILLYPSNALAPASLRADIRFGRQSCVRTSMPITFTLAWLARSKAMTTPRSRRFPVTVTSLPVTRCQLCDRTLAYRPGNISEVLTDVAAEPTPKRWASPPNNGAAQFQASGSTATPPAERALVPT